MGPVERERMGMKKDEKITPEEAKAILTVLDRTWIPNSTYDQFTSALVKLTAISQSPQHPVSIEITI